MIKVVIFGPKMTDLDMKICVDLIRIFLVIFLKNSAFESNNILDFEISKINFRCQVTKHEIFEIF